MSARSRALADMAAHFALLAEQAGPAGGFARYTAPEVWERAADMAHRYALEERWRERIPRVLRSWRGDLVWRARTWRAAGVQAWERARGR